MNPELIYMPDVATVSGVFELRLREDGQPLFVYEDDRAIYRQWAPINNWWWMHQPLDDYDALAYFDGFNSDRELMAWFVDAQKNNERYSEKQLYLVCWEIPNIVPPILFLPK
jgi:hypothetical protein